jgi:hypothetical protein
VRARFSQSDDERKNQMAKSVQQEIRELRQRVRQLEGGQDSTVDEIVGTPNDEMAPTRTTLASALQASGKKTWNRRQFAD